MAQERMWTVARFPDGSWTHGGRADDPDYALCEVFRVLAFDSKQAVKKAQAERRRNIKKQAKK
jgi:hypothetical protein